MTLQLEVLSCERLMAQDDLEVQKLVRVCSGTGIFFLNIQGLSTKGILAELGPIIGAQRNFFAREPSYKMAYTDDRDGRG